MRLFITFYFSIFLVGALFSQTTIILTADRDNTIYSESTNSNGAGPVFFVGANQAVNKRRGLLHFDLSSLPTGATIAAASLNMYVERLATGAPTQIITAYKLTAGWGEGTSIGQGQGSVATTNDATWLTRFTGTPSPWATAGGDFIATPSGNSTVTSIGAISITGQAITNDAQSWINTPSSNNGWIITGNETQSQSAMSLYTRESTIVPTRPTLSITYTSLPVTLVNFTAQARKSDVVLHWSTATEINNQYFGIEHSTYGRWFTEISRITGAGNSALQKSYRYIHENVTGKQHFYRLAQHDFDGTIRYSRVVLVHVESNKPGLLAAPNPAISEIRVLTFALLADLPYQIVNSYGQVMMTGTLSQQKIDVSKLVTGNYTLVVISASGERLTASFVKNNL